MPEHPEAASTSLTRWFDRLTIVNLRGRPDDARFIEAAGAALGAALPLEPTRSVAIGDRRILPAGPDDWFVLDATVGPDVLVARLREAVAGSHAAVTDVSSGYAVLRLNGPPAREVLARGCPLDLHERVFGIDRCAGSHFFKASVWLWQTDARPVFEVLVRTSFRDYVRLMLDRSVSAAGLAPAIHRALRGDAARGTSVTPGSH